MLQVRLENDALIPDGNVIRADEYQACVDARKIIENAQSEATRIIEEANAEADALKDEGYQSGLLDGKLEMAGKMVDSVTRTVEYFTNLEEQVVNIVMQCLSKVVGEMNNRDVVVGVARNALTVARNQRNVTLRVCPEEVPDVRGQLNEILSDFPGITFLEVEADSRLKAGGCILETEIGIVDASVDVQLKAIHKSLNDRIGSSHD